MVTKEQAMTGQVFVALSPDGHPLRTKGGSLVLWRRNGMTKIWKTRPNDFRVPVKRGLHNCDYITPGTAHLVELLEVTEARDKYDFCIGTPDEVIADRCRDDGDDRNANRIMGLAGV